MKMVKPKFLKENGLFPFLSKNKKWDITCGECSFNWVEKIPIIEYPSCICQKCGSLNSWLSSEFYRYKKIQRKGVDYKDRSFSKELIDKINIEKEKISSPDKMGFYFYWDKNKKHSRPKICRLIPTFNTFAAEFSDGECIYIDTLPSNSIWGRIEHPDWVEEFYNFNGVDKCAWIREKYGK